jgi:hypothetical protein
LLADAELARFLEAAEGAVFLAAGAVKARDPDQLVPFLTQTGTSQRRARQVAAATPAVEGAVGGALVAGLVPIAATGVAALLALVFALLQARAFAASGGKSGCRCFGSLDVSSPPAVGAVRSLAFAGAAVAALVTAPVAWLPGWTDSTVAATALGCLAGATFVMAFALVSQVLAFERWRPRAAPSLLRGDVDGG